jgi:drug/metabolite transporter (DMT)-like permease
VSRRGLALFAAMCVIWGIPYLLIKVSLEGFSPVALVFVRFVLGAVILVPIALTRVDVRPILRRWGWVVAYTVIEMGVPWVLLSDAEQRISSSLSGLLVSSVPLIGVVIGLLTRSRERHGWRRILGLVIGLVGVLGVVLLHEPFTGGIAVGFVLILCGSVLAARAAPARR